MTKRTDIVSTHIENQLNLLRENVTNNKPFYDVEPDLLEWAQFQAKIWVKRFTEKGSPTFAGTDRTVKNYAGLLGQKIFEIILQQLEIPYVPNDPTLDWSATKKYDFKIPHVGTIEVKTTEAGSNRIRVLVNRTDWKHSDYCVAVKLNDAKPLTAIIAGYATCKEVENDFKRADYEHPCPNMPCYWQLLEGLHSANVFLSMLQKQTAQCWK